ncbi:MAG: hypothetical protein ACR2OX_11530 [Methyloligellaceae bacterium]
MHLLKAVQCLVAGLFILGLSGCAVYESLPYPNISNIQGLDNKALSADERDKTIQEMTVEQEQHQDTIIGKRVKKN